MQAILKLFLKRYNIEIFSIVRPSIWNSCYVNTHWNFPFGPQWQPFFKMADSKYRFFYILAYISLRIMIQVSTYTFSETRIPIKLISNDFRPQWVSVAAIISKWPTKNTGFSVSQPIFHLASWSRCLHIHFRRQGFH